MPQATTLGATYSLLFDLDGNGTPEHELIDMVQEIRYVVGRSSPLEPNAPGTMTVVAADPKGDFSPWKAASTYFPEIRERRRLQLKCTKGSTYNLFYGRLMRPKPGIRSLQTSFECVDEATFALNRREVTTALHQQLTSKALIGKVLDAVGWTGGRSIRETRDRISFAWWTHQRGQSAMLEIADAEGGFWFTDGAGVFTYYDRHENVSRAAAVTSQLDLTDADTAEFSEPYPDLDGLINAARVTAQGRKIGPLTNIWQIPSFTLAPGQSRTIFTHHGGPATDIRSMVSGTDYKAVNAANSKETMTGNVVIDSFTTYAETGKIVVRNSHGSKTIRVTVFRVRGRFITDSHTVTKTSNDSTSIGTYGENVRTTAPRLLSHSDVAQDQASMWVRHYKDPRIRVSVTIESKSSALLDQILARGLGDRIRITNSYFGWTNEPFWIQRKSGVIFPGRELHRMTWDLISVRASDYWKLGSTALSAAVVGH